MEFEEQKWESYIDSMDIAGLIAQGAELKDDPESLMGVALAIEEVLGIYRLDFYAHKGGDPKNSDYLMGIEALEDYKNTDLPLMRIDFYLYCVDYSIRQQDTFSASDLLEKTDTLLRELYKKAPTDHAIYAKLLLSLNYSIEISGAKCDELVNQMLDLIESCGYPSDEFFISSLDSLLKISDNGAQALRTKNLQKELLDACAHRGDLDPKFALKMGFYMEELLETRPQFADPYLDLFLSKALKHKPEPEIHSLCTQGHLYTRAGVKLGKIVFLQKAEELFLQANSLPEAFPLICTYINNAKENRSRLLEREGKLKLASDLKEEIAKNYLNHWKENLDISYLSHAIEYSLNYTLEDLRTRGTSAQIDTIKQMALAAEKLGNSNYWFCYRALFDLYLLENNKDEAMLWLAKAYYKFNSLIENQIQDLLLELKEKNIQDIAEFLERLCDHLKNQKGKPRQEVSSPTYEDLASLDMNKFVTWLTAR